MRSHDYGRDILNTPKRKKVPEIPAVPGLVVEDPASGFCGAVVKFEGEVRSGSETVARGAILVRRGSP